MKQERQNKKEEEAELVKLDPVDKKLFYKVDYRELLIDSLFILYAFFISESLFEKNGLFQTLQPWQIIGMFCGVVLTMPYYLGYLYVRFSHYFPKFVMKIILWIFILITLGILINLVRLTFLVGDVEEFKYDANGFFAAFSMFMLVLGPMMCIAGAMQANLEFTSTAENPYKFDPYRFSGMGAFFIIILAIAFMIYFIGLFPEGSGSWVVLVAFLGGPFAAVVVFALFLGFLTLLDKIGIYKYLVLATKYTFPFFIISILVFWSGVSINLMINDFSNETGKVSAGGMVFSVIMSGLIPFRIIMILMPPFRITNIAVGVLVLGFFIYSLISLT